MEEGEINEEEIAQEKEKINNLSEQKIKEKQSTEEDEYMEANVEYVSKSGDLSPRQIGNLKEKIKKAPKQDQPQSQRNTRSKKGSFFTSD
ncbi:hypothetical protein KY290_025239 [Solanum tuberosum]|uniref:Uncharacterized protein n=1 Tax=Solanum tuberosum TaxID=4113 RepID=A0ABQ7UT55_SOLTU|nr:hypothetical protein KY284_024042 [Solanum tuberosum]KAH0754969.1 hypothetical protein KY290_025239 [Solanum tuberosum]